MDITFVNVSMSECDRLLRTLNVEVDDNSKEQIAFKIELNQLLSNRYRLGKLYGADEFRTKLMKGICDSIKEL